MICPPIAVPVLKLGFGSNEGSVTKEGSPDCSGIGWRRGRAKYRGKGDHMARAPKSIIVPPDRRSCDLPTVGQSAYPAGIRVGGHFRPGRRAYPYFSSTILMDLVYSGVTNKPPPETPGGGGARQRRWRGGSWAKSQSVQDRLITGIMLQRREHMMKTPARRRVKAG